MQMAKSMETKTKVKLIDYQAPWCGPCRAMEPVMAEVKQELGSQVEFSDIDVDKEPDKANAAGVMSIPTFHIVKDGQIIQVLIGYQSKDEMLKHLRAALG